MNVPAIIETSTGNQYDFRTEKENVRQNRNYLIQLARELEAIATQIAVSSTLEQTQQGISERVQNIAERLLPMEKEIESATTQTIALTNSIDELASRVSRLEQASKPSSGNTNRKKTT